MRGHCMIIFLIMSLFTSFNLRSINGAQSNCAYSTYEQNTRRILHQPLFPIDSEPPPPPPPPPPATPDTSEGDQPFSNEIPEGPTFDQTYQPPLLPDTGAAVVSPSPTTPPSNPAKKLVIAILSALLTVGMLSAMAFLLYKNRAKHNDESDKLVGDNLQRIDEESRVPPPAFLCIESAEPSTRSIVSEANVASGSPYRKLNSGTRLDHFRPSPDLQPLPPLTKLPPPPRMSSPPPMSSSDDESHDTRFCTSASNKSPSSRNQNAINKIRQVSHARADDLASRPPVPHSKRTPPKSRFSVSSPDTRPVMVPSVKLSLPPSPPSTTSMGPLQSSKPLSFSPTWTKFSASPPSPGIEQCRSMTNYEQKASKIIIPPPPPPPPPPPSMTKKYGAAKIYTPKPVFKQTRRSQSKSPSPKASPSSEKRRHVEEVNEDAHSSEKINAEKKEGSRPKMKPLHWDKVRATADRATVWDHLKSTSFKLNEGAMESLFGCNTTTPVPREATRKFVLPCTEQENRILDSKKSQNIAILLRALNVTREEISEALLDGM